MKEYKLFTLENVFACSDIASHICLVLESPPDHNSILKPLRIWYKM